jgi:hypothetical protein
MSAFGLAALTPATAKLARANENNVDLSIEVLLVDGVERGLAEPTGLVEPTV